MLLYALLCAMLLGWSVAQLTNLDPPEQLIVENVESYTSDTSRQVNDCIKKTKSDINQVVQEIVVSNINVQKNILAAKLLSLKCNLLHPLSDGEYGECFVENVKAIQNGTDAAINKLDDDLKQGSSKITQAQSAAISCITNALGKDIY